MNAALSRVRIGEGIYFSHIPDAKFKRNLISIDFIVPLDASTASVNALVPHILRKSCRQYPDFSAFTARLENLYGASLSAGVAKINGWQIISVSIQGLDSRFALEGEDIAQECASLLAAVVLDPKRDENGLLDAVDVELEKQFILDTIEAEINDKRSYAIRRCMQLMCKGEPVAIDRFGDTETAEAITPRSATEAYENLLKTAAIEISFTGSGSSDSARALFTDAFADRARDAVTVALVPLRTAPQQLTEVTETMELNQAKLVMGLRCGVAAGDEDIYAMRLCAAMLGGTPFSKFFLNVREKLSLCYYCSAGYDQYNNLLLVDSGIEAANKQLAQDEIFRQIAAMQAGNFTDQEIAETKMLVANSLTKVADSPSAMESWYLSQTINGRCNSPLDELAALNAVTRAQIVAAAAKLAPDTIYFLTGNEADDENTEAEKEEC